MSSVEDRLDVIETCTKVSWYVDQREWDALYGVFTDKVLVDYTSLNGGEPSTVDAGALIDSWSGLLGNLSSTQHMITNFLVDVRGDEAVCTAMFQAVHRLPNALGGPHWTLGGQYRWTVLRTGAGWRISAMTMTALWSEGNRHIMTPEGQGA
ncbi:nuclear transport factor 2 family protein [Streptomyces sp. NPDC051322]|uniref:nuclear transport factor 2 family protein n=1 Tax=Streptomyces sp. NPDC051322 TaxID=3154645 RepID=UPI00344DED57